MSGSLAEIGIIEEPAVSPDPENPTVINRPTEELVIGMVGAVGAGVTTSAKLLKEILENDYGYSVSIIRASDVIRENCGKTNVANPPSDGPKRITDLQKIGTELRDKFGEDYVISKVIEKIAAHRKTNGGYSEGTVVTQPNPMRWVTIVDSIKHPSECNLLRRVYEGIYWQFTVFAPEPIRESRLKDQGINREDLAGIFTRDENDQASDHGQKVSKTAFLSDFFVRNDCDNDQALKTSLNRFIEIIFNISVHTPNSDEAGMFAAMSAASKSACLSRQVGAAIYSEAGELVSVGWNDVPIKGGGLYTSDNDSTDHRCYKWQGKECHNDKKKTELYKKIYKSLQDEGLLKDSIGEKMVEKALLRTPIRDIIEYSRSIHAEMEAIVSAARSGKIGMVGGTLYTTTFPCHNCARHIVAAGIKKVYYVEPYAKSLALDLHSDAITTNSDDLSKVKFLQYEGVGPSAVFKLFNHGTERKNNGKAKVVSRKSAVPVLKPPLDGFTSHEKRVMSKLHWLESGKKAEESKI